MACVSAFRIAICALWLVAVGAGLAVVAHLQSIGGRAAETPQRWPMTASIPLATGNATLLLFAHAQSSSATSGLEQLQRLIAQCDGRVTAHVFFFSPAQLSSEWTTSDLWRKASA